VGEKGAQRIKRSLTRERIVVMERPRSLLKKLRKFHLPKGLLKMNIQPLLNKLQHLLEDLSISMIFLEWEMLNQSLNLKILTSLDPWILVVQNNRTRVN